MLSVPLCSLQCLGGAAPSYTTLAGRADPTSRRAAALPKLAALEALPALEAPLNDDADDLYDEAYVPSWVCVPRRSTLDVLEELEAPEAPEAPELVAPPPIWPESPNAQVWKMPDTEPESDETDLESDASSGSDTELDIPATQPDWPYWPDNHKRKHAEAEGGDSKRSRSAEPVVQPYFVEFADGSFAI